MPEQPIYYSTNTLLAFNISERYYNHLHFVWCTPYFDVWANQVNYTVPATSSPKEIYQNLLKEVTGEDRHGTQIDANKVGLKKGASVKRAANLITEQQENDIYAIIDSAKSQMFKPLLYVIPYDRVANIIQEVPVQERANPLSVEYRIELLPRDSFDVLRLE
jgi:hypothetical protein